MFGYPSILSDDDPALSRCLVPLIVTHTCASILMGTCTSLSRGTCGLRGEATSRTGNPFAYCTVPFEVINNERVTFLSKRSNHA